MWMYHSHTDEALDTWAGLFGSIIITRKGGARADGTAIDVDRNILLTFSVLDESASFLLAENSVKYLNQAPALLTTVKRLFAPPLPFIPNGRDQQIAAVLNALYPGGPTAEQDDSFQESNKMHSINGYNFCNLPNLEAVIKQRTRVHIQVFGDVIDLHTPNLFGGSFLEHGQEVQSLRLLPGSMTTTDLTPVVAGSWVLQCRVNDHIAAGMRARLSVSGSSLVSSATAGPVRVYYIAAVKGPWTFAADQNLCTDPPSAFDLEQRKFTKDFIGSTYTKARYMQYSSATFRTPVAQPATNGILGPVITVEVGDVVQIVFTNKVPDASGQVFLSSLKIVSGLVPVSATLTVGAVTKTVVGTEAVRLLLDAGVRHGDTLTVDWVAPAAAGPQGLDVGGVVAYTCLDGADQISHTHAGLVGLVLVGSIGTFYDANGRLITRPVGRDFLFPLLYTIFDESQSPFLDENVAAAVAAGKMQQSDVGAPMSLGKPT
jgi:hephaestin